MRPWSVRMLIALPYIHWKYLKKINNLKDKSDLSDEEYFHNPWHHWSVFFLQPILGDANLKLQMFPERFAFTWWKANGKRLEKQDKTWKWIDWTICPTHSSLTFFPWLAPSSFRFSSRLPFGVWRPILNILLYVYEVNHNALQHLTKLLGVKYLF